MISRMRAAMYSLLKFITLAVVLLNLLDFSHQLERREKRGYNQDDGDDYDDDDDEDYDRRRQMALAYQRSQGYFQPRYRPLSRRQLARGQEAQAALLSAQQRMMHAVPLASNHRSRRSATQRANGQDQPYMMNQRSRNLDPAMQQLLEQRSHILPKHMPMESAEQRNIKPRPVESAAQKNHKGRPMSYEEFKKHHPMGRLSSGANGTGGWKEPYPGFWLSRYGDVHWTYGNNTDDPNWVDYGEGVWYGNNTDDPNWVDYLQNGYAHYGNNTDDPNWVDSFGGFRYGRNEEDPNWVDPYPQWWKKFTTTTAAGGAAPTAQTPATLTPTPTPATTTTTPTTTTTTSTDTPATTTTTSTDTPPTTTTTTTTTTTPPPIGRQVADKRAWKMAREKASQVCPTRACGQKDVASKCQCVAKAGIPWSHYCISMKARDPCCEKWAVASCPETLVF